MTTATVIDWNTATHAGLVSIGNHSLYLNASGPPRKSPADPVVIIEAGMASCSYEHILVQRLIAQFARVYSYDRAGLGNSEMSLEPVTGENRAKELKRLLEAAEVAPPYVTVGHSFGGILVREFLACVGAGEKGVVGMVFVDANQEKIYFSDEFFGCIGKLVGEEGSLGEIIGLDANTLMTREEWQIYKDLDKKGEAASHEEMKLYRATAAALAEKKQFETQPLGDERISVIKGSTFTDFSKLLAWADAHDRPADARDVIRKALEAWDEEELDLQKEQLKLSSQGRLVYAQGVGLTHNLQLTQPGLIAAEVKWVLGIE